jgi:hypothetical protein
MIEKSFSIVIGRSKWLLAYLVIIHNLILVTMVTLLPNIGSSFMAVALISTSFIYYCGRYQWLKSYRAIIKLERNSKKKWTVFHSDNTSQKNLVLKHCVVTPKLIILYYSGSSRWRGKSITILEDAVNAELFRQLRVYLRAPKTFP